MKTRNGILTGLIAACAACLILVAGCLQSPQISNKPTMETAMATVSVSYVVEDVVTTHLGFFVDLTAGRAQSMAAAVVGLISLVIGGLALRSAGRTGAGNGRAGAIVALALGLIGMLLSVVHLAGSTGFGTGGGRAGAIVALVLALIGMSLGGLALARSRRPRSTD